MRHIIFECSAHEANRFKNLKEGTMQKKIIAAAVIAMMMIAGVAMVSDDSDANKAIADGSEVTIYNGDTVGENLLFKYNESAYDHYETTETLKVAISDSEMTVGSIDYKTGSDLIISKSYTEDSITFKLINEGAENYTGNYWVKVSASGYNLGDSASKTIYVAVQFQVTLEIGSNIAVTPVTTVFKLTIKAPETATISASNAIAQVGKNFESQLELTTPSPEDKDLLWYAELPDGLAVDPESGKITGMPKTPVVEDECYVIVTDKTTNIVYAGTIKLTVNEASETFDEDITITISATNAADSSKVSQVIGGIVYAEQGTGLTLTVSTTNGSVLDRVLIVDSDGNVINAALDNISTTGVSIDSNGTGRYMIYVESIAPNGLGLSETVYLEIYSQTLNVTAEIIGSSS